MPQSTAAGIITACGTVLTAIALVITAIGGYIRSKKVEKKVDSVECKVEDASGKIDGVHVIVNQQRTDLQRYQRALIATLKSHGIDPPADQSVESVDTTPHDQEEQKP